MDPILYLIIIPFVLGFFCFALPRDVKGAGEASSLLGSASILIYAFYLFTGGTDVNTTYFLLDHLSRFLLLATGFFGLLISLYSISFMAGNQNRNKYYSYVLWTLGSACGVLMANHLVLLLVFWGFLGFTLYLLIEIGGSEAADASKKTFIILGGSDGIMVLGIAMIWVLTGHWRMDQVNINLVQDASFLPIAAFICLFIAAIAKAGAVPFHTWIPDCAAKAPIPATALLPASLDKLLGIYLLARIVITMFVVNTGMQFLMFLVGALTILIAVFMALPQHNFKKLLSYCAISQVGYMVLGIATGTTIGIAGGLFHMLNHAIYKSCLFLCGGAVEKRTGIDNMDKLGGLIKFMPVTFITCFVAAMAVSGVPPFNGFASKWMVYQSLIKFGRDEGGWLWIVWLVAAMFGSAFTLAIVMKLIHSIFLGQQSKEVAKKKIREVPFTMWIPMAILALLCVIFGIFAVSTALKYFILPSIIKRGGVSYLGFWEPVLATLFILIGLFLGAIIYFLGRPGAVRETDIYVGGEILEKGYQVTGADFYRTVQEMGFLKAVYKMAEHKLFDIYVVGKGLVFSISRVFQVLHTGVLPFYLIWCLLGMVVLLLVFFAGGQ